MLENLFTNVFGKPKNKSSGRPSQPDLSSGATTSTMTGPFSVSTPQLPQMPQPPSLPYPAAAPYPPIPDHSANYPSLPFSQPMPSLPDSYQRKQQPHEYPTGTLAASANHLSPLDSVPFEMKLSLNDSSNHVTLDQLFRDIKKAADVVDRADAYLRSDQSDYNFRTEQSLISQ